METKNENDAKNAQYIYIYIYTVVPKKVVQWKYILIYIYIYRSRGYYNIWVNARVILPCVFIARSI